MEIVDFFEDAKAWEKDELFFPLRRYFGPYENNPYDGRSNSEIKSAFLDAIHADRSSSFDISKIRALKISLGNEGVRFQADFPELLPDDFKVLLFPMKSSWDYVMKHLDGTWGVTFPSCVVLGAHPDGNLDRLSRTLHHEANHSIRLKFIEDDHCFLDRIILEGLAEVYVDEKFPSDPPSKYVVTATEADVRKWLPDLASFWRKDDFKFEDYKTYLYGSEELKIPRWLGYAVGYHLVKLARRNRFQGVPWRKLIQLPSSEFICSSPER